MSEIQNHKIRRIIAATPLGKQRDAGKIRYHLPNFLPSVCPLTSVLCLLKPDT